MGLEVDVIRESFALVAPRADELTEKFYATLFVRHPEVVPMFEGVDMSTQRMMLKQALAFVVNNIERPDVLTEKLEELGARHVGYGAKAEHYPLVGECLLEALESIAGESWSGKTAVAWADAYAAITQIMLAGAAKAEEANVAQ
jgi:hemoglobin-like flavoprotein